MACITSHSDLCPILKKLNEKKLKKNKIFFKKIEMVIKPSHFEIDMADKPHLNLIITGHIDNGKSTTMGHFLMDLG